MGTMTKMASIHGGRIPQMYTVTVMIRYVGFPREYALSRPFADPDDQSAIVTGKEIVYGETRGDEIDSLGDVFVVRWNDDGSFTEVWRDRSGALAV